MRMPQSSVIFGALLIGFIFYITIKGELIQYIKVIYGPAPTEAQAEGPGISPTASTTPAKSGGGFLAGLDLGGIFGPFGGGGDDPVGTSSSTITFGDPVA
jgi:hypothetical protein